MSDVHETVLRSATKEVVIGHGRRFCLIGERIKGRKLYGHLYDDLLKLKYLHQRYTNYVAWLRMQ